MISTVESHLPNVSYPNLHCPSPQNGDFRKIFKVFTALIRPENKKKVQLVHSLSPALTLTLQTLNQLANKPQQTTSALFGLITVYGSTPYVGMAPKKKMAATLKVHK